MKKRHLWIMLFCCLLPIVGLAAIFLLDIPANTVLYFALILLCPIGHLFMMGQMGRGHDDGRPNGHVPMTVKDKK